MNTPATIYYEFDKRNFLVRPVEVTKITQDSVWLGKNRKNKVSNRFDYYPAGEAKTSILTHCNKISTELDMKYSIIAALRQQIPILDTSRTSISVDEKIKNFGFTHIGQWVFDRIDQKSAISSDTPRIEFDIKKSSALKEEDVLYAFTSGKEILYIGETEGNFRQRIYGYKYRGPGTTSTNLNVGQGIALEYLKKGYEVKIWYMPTHIFDWKLTEQIGKRKSRKGIERFLIQSFNPKFNKRS